MIEQLELNWSRFDSEWKSIIQDKKSSYELCHNQSTDTYSIICQDKDLIYFNAFRRRAVENSDNLLWGSVCIGSLIFDDNLEIVELERGKHSWYKLIDAFGEFIMYQYDDTGSYMLYRYESHKKKYVKCNYYCKKIPQPVIITPYEEGALYFDLTTDKFVLSEEIIRKQRKSWIRVDDSYSLYDAFENDSEVQNYLNK